MNKGECAVPSVGLPIDTSDINTASLRFNRQVVVGLIAFLICAFQHLDKCDPHTHFRESYSKRSALKSLASSRVMMRGSIAAWFSR